MVTASRMLPFGARALGHNFLFFKAHLTLFASKILGSRETIRCWSEIGTATERPIRPFIAVAARAARVLSSIEGRSIIRAATSHSYRGVLAATFPFRAIMTATGNRILPFGGRAT